VCPFYLDGEPTGRRSVSWGYFPSLAFVQFSSIVEDGRRGTPAPRSLRTEQRGGRTRGPAPLKSGRLFRTARRPEGRGADSLGRRHEAGTLRAP
jgi:hypothetical protein